MQAGSKDVPALLSQIQSKRIYRKNIATDHAVTDHRANQGIERGVMDWTAI
jgi:hypothetical protein